MVASAFNSSIPFGGSIVALCSLFFGFTSLVAWAYYGEQGLRFLIGGRKPGITYRLAWCVLAFVGSIYGVKLIWAGAYVKILGMNNLEDVDPDFLFALGDHYLRRGMPARALEFADRLLEASPDYPQAEEFKAAVEEAIRR